MKQPLSPNNQHLSAKLAGIYDPYLDTVGGGERYALTFAEALLNKGWQVDIFWPDNQIKEKLMNKFSLDIERVNFIPYSPRVNNVLKRYSIENKYNVLFYFSDGSIPLMFGQKNLLHFQVPFHNVKGQKISNRFKIRFIDKFICNSLFTKNIVDKEYGINGDVWYPPIEIDEFSPASKKENYILAVGRFEKSMTEKRQDVLVESFKKMANGGLKNWKLIIAGGRSTDETKNEIIKDLKDRAKGYPIELKINVPFTELKDLYAKAKIFWHAAGFGSDEEKNPEKVEHFGMTTVEAMSAGCVPVVINKGGQKEIIDDNINGYLWETENELLDQTMKIIKNIKTIHVISSMAIKRSRDFSKEKFFEKIYNLLCR